jgi:type IV pilus assembly protein PilM
MAKGVWGIDVSKYSLKAVRLEGTRESVVLTRIAVVPYDRAEGDEQDLDQHIRNALTTLVATQRVGNEPVILSLPSHSTFNRLIKLPPVDDEKIPEIVRYEATSQIPFNIDEVLWDYQYVDRKYGPGEEKEVILFAIKRDIVEQFLGNLSDTGINVDAVQFGPVALFNFLLKDQDLGGPSVALDMGGDNTDLIVIDGSKFWVRNLPITGNDITKSLQKAFNIPFAEAEKLKLKAGQSQQAQKIFNAVQPVLRDLVNEVNRSTGYYKSISKTSKFEKIILLGNSTKTLNFQKFVSQSLQLPAVRVQKLNHIAVSAQVDQADLGENLGTLGTALGLALQGITDTANRINLLPPAYVRKKELAKKKPYVIGAVAALFVMVGLMWYTGNAEVDRLTATANIGRKLQKDIETQKKAFQEARQVEAVEAALKTVAQVSSERDLILKMMDEIIPNIPNNGDTNIKDDQRLWVVDWQFDERVRAAAAPAPGTAPPPAPAGHLLPREKFLVATLEVCISKRNSDEEGRSFITQKLLNWNVGGKAPADGRKPCVVKNKNWTLADGQGPAGYWRVEQDATENLDRPLPKEWKEPPGGPGGGTPASVYWRYRVTLEIPVGEAQRKAAAEAAKTPAPAPEGK